VVIWGVSSSLFPSFSLFFPLFCASYGVCDDLVNGMLLYLRLFFFFMNFTIGRNTGLVSVEYTILFERASGEVSTIVWRYILPAPGGV
jgi:hypothetical protein